MAVHRSLPAATDDRKARRLGIDFGLSVISTPELVMAWASHATAADPLRSEWDRLEAG